MSRYFLLALVLLPACNGGEGGAETVVLQSKGSDTMVNLMQRLSEEYTKTHPNVIVAVTGGGSGTGIKALIDKTTDMANTSRPMKDDEIEQAKKNGVEPVATIAAHDGLAIYVHPSNPIKGISFEELKCIYASDGTCHHWKDVGVTIDCGGGDDSIAKVGRQNNSGTYEYFRDEILGKDGRFTSTMDQSGTQQVVDVVGTTPCAIGYGGMGYHSDKAHFVCLSKDKGGECHEPTTDSVKGGTYPFSRELFVYTNGAASGATKEFLDWTLGPDGQKVVVDSGFVPL